MIDLGNIIGQVFITKHRDINAIIGYDNVSKKIKVAESMYIMSHYTAEYSRYLTIKELLNEMDKDEWSLVDNPKDRKPYMFISEGL